MKIREIKPKRKSLPPVHTKILFATEKQALKGNWKLGVMYNDGPTPVFVSVSDSGHLIDWDEINNSDKLNDLYLRRGGILDSYSWDKIELWVQL